MLKTAEQGRQFQTASIRVFVDACLFKKFVESLADGSLRDKRVVSVSAQRPQFSRSYSDVAAERGCAHLQLKCVTESPVEFVLSVFRQRADQLCQFRLEHQPEKIATY